MKYSFKSDYCELAHPQVFEALSKVGTAQFEGYGLDVYSNRAADLIRKAISSDDADVHFVSGGTQANLLVISSALRPHEAVIAAESGHISVHEAGAIEATGHKVCAVSSADGKLCPDDIEMVVRQHSDEHMVLPRLVYISQSTETGKVYTKAELRALSEICRKHDLYLYIDGARLGVALGSDACDASYADVAQAADVFYIGGTKNGALFGEAIVIVNEALKRDFRYHAKQRGALLAKGAAISIQFQALFEDGLYERIALHSNAMAKRLAEGIKNAGYNLMFPVQTNMVFPTLPFDVVNKLHRDFDFHDWLIKGDDVTARLVTSWATTEEAVDRFVCALL